MYLLVCYFIISKKEDSFVWFIIILIVDNYRLLFNENVRGFLFDFLLYVMEDFSKF